MDRILPADYNAEALSVQCHCAVIWTEIKVSAGGGNEFFIWSEIRGIRSLFGLKSGECTLFDVI